MRLRIVEKEAQLQQALEAVSRFFTNSTDEQDRPFKELEAAVLAWVRTGTITPDLMRVSVGSVVIRRNLFVAKLVMRTVRDQHGRLGAEITLRRFFYPLLRITKIDEKTGAQVSLLRCYPFRWELADVARALELFLNLA